MVSFDYGYCIDHVRYLFFEGCELIDRITSQAKAAAERGLMEHYHLMSDPSQLADKEAKIVALTKGLESLGFSVEFLVESGSRGRLKIGW